MKLHDKIVVRVEAADGTHVARAKIVSANYSKKAQYLTRVEPHEPASHTLVPVDVDNEGVTWAKGWDTQEANALRSAVMLAT